MALGKMAQYGIQRGPKMNPQTIADHYILAAIWADSPEGSRPRATQSARAAALRYVTAFTHRYPGLTAAAMSAEGYGSHPDAGSPEGAFGHDLWLTTQGHGVGFWDRPELDAVDLGDNLSEACRQFGAQSYDFYRGWLYLRDWRAQS